MDRHLEPLQRGSTQKGFELNSVQIVRSRQTFQPTALHEIFRRERVGDVEREVPNATFPGEEAQVVVIADQVAVGFGGTHLFENPVLAGFENAWRGD